ncbi:hypothetical protein [Marinobacter xestospongiae]|uniref:hypothetical protein n=1 Tax=Marinobacter xestospongiae TaxID=994319 RepID=UPI0020045824|nr:hypothetical protein [Marinobacter xestospongiae]MCK7569182.1 hypothetical protein [Marinobacter xestospongiae]
MEHSNGCGPAWMSRLWLTRKLQHLLFNCFFEASCNKHDQGYQQGGDEIRRFECDWKFFQTMRRDTLRQRGVLRLVCWVMAVTFFALVRVGGWRHFNYTGRSH